MTKLENLLISFRPQTDDRSIVITGSFPLALLVREDGYPQYDLLTPCHQQFVKSTSPLDINDDDPSAEKYCVKCHTKFPHYKKRVASVENLSIRLQEWLIMEFEPLHCQLVSDEAATVINDFYKDMRLILQDLGTYNHWNGTKEIRDLCLNYSKPLFLELPTL